MTPQDALNEPIARRILAKVLDRLDVTPAPERANAIRIPIDSRTAPEIFAAQTTDDRSLAWHVIALLEKGGFGQLEFQRSVRHGPPHERKPSFVFSLSSEDNIRTAYHRPRRGPSYVTTWRELVEASDLSDRAKDIIRESPLSVSNRTADEVFKRLLTLRAEAGAVTDDLLREVSARAFWGLSKLLDGREELVAAVLDRESCPYPPQPIHLTAYFAGPYTGQLIFIENKTSFERAIRDARGGQPSYNGMAIIYSSGFVASWKNLRKMENVRLFYSIDDVSHADWINTFAGHLFSDLDMPTFFWGDLDYSGMAILHRLRDNFPSAAAWQPGYAAMLKQLVDGAGHTPDEGGKSNQRPIFHTGCAYADDMLLPAISRTGKFVDQEGFRCLDRSAAGPASI